MTRPTTKPTNDNGPTPPQSQPAKTIITAPIVGADVDDRNHLADLKALASKAGHTLIEGYSGYLLIKWGLVIHCTSLNAVSAALLRMGVKP